MKRFKNILYVFEDAAEQTEAIARAVSLAQNNQADMTVIDVMPKLKASTLRPPGSPTPAALQAAIAAERRQQLQALTEPHRQQLPIEIDVLSGSKFLEIIRAVLRHQYDLVIKTAEDPDWIERLFGSDDMHLLRKCPCPVWLMKPNEKSNYASIVAAIDLDLEGDATKAQSLNREILELASSLALSDFAELHIVHVWDAPEAGFVRMWADNPKSAETNIIESERSTRQGAMADLSHWLRQQIGAEGSKYLSPRTHLHKGEATTVIPGLVKELKADLVVMGTLARSGIPGLIIGNTAEAILDQLQCSVLAIKPAGFVTPVTLKGTIKGDGGNIF